VTSLSANQRGILAILGCMSAYSVNDALVKRILASHPVGEVIFVRGSMTVLMIGAVLLAFGHGAQLRRALGPTLLSRSAFDGLSTVCFIAALANLPMASVAAVLQIAPLLITALAAMIYREAVGWRRWAAIAVGFAGALLIVKPAPSTFDVFALVAAGSALFAALREMQTRRIDSNVPTLVIAFWGAVAITLFGGMTGFSETWLPISAAELAQLAVASVFVGIAIYLMAAGFRNVDLSVVAPFRYSYLITSAIAGYLVFSEVPDRWSMAGAALIVASGLYALHREAVRRRELTARAGTAA
jgi:drug/metabolite transporter (DMT)-like permease